MTKQCSKCKEIKDVSEFGNNRTRRDGLQSQCKQCRKAYRKSNREKIRASNKAYRKANREKFRAYQKAYYESNREKILAYHKAYQKAYYESNREKIRASEKAYYESNREKIIAHQKAYQKANREKVRAFRKIYKQKRRREDPSFRLKCNLRRATCKVFAGKSKPASTMNLLGCTQEFAMAHLESQFTEGMSWDNYGEGSVPKGQRYWEVDHIFPMAKADVTDPAQAYAVCKWQNLQPLWREENREKDDKVYPAAKKLFRELCEEFSQRRKVG